MNEGKEVIDYISEVRKTYPDAVLCWHVTDGQMCGWAIFDCVMSYQKMISKITSGKNSAWQSAYESLTPKNH